MTTAVHQRSIPAQRINSVLTPKPKPPTVALTVDKSNQKAINKTFRRIEAANAKNLRKLERAARTHFAVQAVDQKITVIFQGSAVPVKPIVKMDDTKTTEPDVKRYLSRKEHVELKSGRIPTTVENWDLIAWGFGQRKLYERALAKASMVTPHRPRRQFRQNAVAHSLMFA
jgi:hypothetical protein